MSDYTDYGAVVPKPPSPASKIAASIGRWLMFAVGLSCASVCLKTQERTAVDRESCVVSVMACKDMTEAWNKCEEAARVRYDMAAERAHWTTFVTWSQASGQCVTNRVASDSGEFEIHVLTNGVIRLLNITRRAKEEHHE